MKIFYIILRKFFDNKFINIILMIQSFVVIFTMNITAGTLEFKNYLVSLVNQSKLRNAVYFANDYRFEENVDPFENNIMIEKIRLKLQALEEMEHIAEVSEAYTKLPFFNESIKILMNDKYLLERFQIPLSKGDWSKLYDSRTSENPAVISRSLGKHYNVGEVITINVEGLPGEKKVCNIRIVGILKEPEYHLNLRSGGNFLTINNIFNRNDLFMVTPPLKDDDGNEIKGIMHNGKILFAKKNKDTSEVYGKWREETKDIGDLHTIDEMIVRFNNSIKKETSIQVTFEVLLVLLTISGIGGNNILKTIYSRKEHALYFMCGLQWSKCIIISVLNDIVILVIPALFGYFAVARIPYNAFKNDIIINSSNFILTMFFILSVYIATSLGTIINMHRLSPVSIIRRWE